MSAEQVMLSNHVILCHCRILPSIFPSIRVFSKESQSVYKMKAPISLFQCHSSVAFPGRATFKATPDKYVCWKRTTRTHTHTHTQETTIVLFSTILQVFHIERKRLQLLTFPALTPLAPLPAVISKQSFIRQLGLIRAETSVIQGGAPSLPQKSFSDERGPDHCCLRFGLLQWAGEMKWFGEAGSGGNDRGTACWWANYLAPLPPGQCARRMPSLNWDHARLSHCHHFWRLLFQRAL